MGLAWRGRLDCWFLANRQPLLLVGLRILGACVVIGVFIAWKCATCQASLDYIQIGSAVKLTDTEEEVEIEEKDIR